MLLSERSCEGGPVHRLPQPRDNVLTTHRHDRKQCSDHALLPFRDACIVHKLGENAKFMNKTSQAARKYFFVLDK